MENMNARPVDPGNIEESSDKSLEKAGEVETNAAFLKPVWIVELYCTLKPASGSDGKLYVLGLDGRTLFQVNPENGEIIKDTTGFGDIKTPPVFAPDGTIFMGDRGGHIYALDPKSLWEKWNVYTGEEVVESPTRDGKGNLMVGSGKTLLAFDEESGDKIWIFEAGEAILVSPAVDSDGNVYVGSNDKKLYCLDGENGWKNWEYETGDFICGNPVITAEDLLVAGSGDGMYHALDKDTGKKKWEFRLPEGESACINPASGPDGVVILAGGKKIYGVHGKTGEIKWEFETGDQVVSNPAVNRDGTVYVGSNDGILYALDGQTGQVAGCYKAGGKVGTPELSPDGVIYVPSDGKVHAIRV